MQSESELFLVTRQEAGIRLDKLLANRYLEHYSRTYFQYLIEESLVSLNGRPVKKREKPEEGDEIEVHFMVTPQIEVEAEPIPLSILYEDEDIIVVDKPAHMVVHPAVGNWSGTFVNALLYHCKELNSDPENIRPGIVHRLDKETSGVLLAAKKTTILQKLVEQFSSRNVEKSYFAICLGNPGEGEVVAPIGRHPVHRKKMAVVEDGKEAKSSFKTLSYNREISLVEVRPFTGRTHQIRVHMRHIGSPVIGDALYGNSSINQKYDAKRQLLHAHNLKITHPTTGKRLTFRAPIPDDMATLIKKIEVLEK